MRRMTPAHSTPIRILVVDDDTAFRERLVRAFISRKFDAHGAAGSVEALAVAARVKPSRAVVDLRMPGDSGLDVVSRLIELDASMQIVILTGYGSIATAVEAVHRGALDYLTKPADADQILAAFTKDHDAAVQPPSPIPSLARVEWEHMQRILTDCGNNISEAARRLGIHRRSLQRKLGKLPPNE